MTINDKPTVPTTPDGLRDAIEALIAAVGDPDATVNGATDGYSKCAEAMWMAGYIAHEYAAAKLGVTGFQHGYSRLKLLGALAGYRGPYMVIDGSDALYPQCDIPGKVQAWLNGVEFRKWAAEQAQERLDQHEGANPRVRAHWQTLAANVTEGERA